MNSQRAFACLVVLTSSSLIIANTQTLEMYNGNPDRVPESMPYNRCGGRTIKKVVIEACTRRPSAEYWLNTTGIDITNKPDAMARRTQDLKSAIANLRIGELPEGTSISLVRRRRQIRHKTVELRNLVKWCCDHFRYCYYMRCPF